MMKRSIALILSVLLLLTLCSCNTPPIPGITSVSSDTTEAVVEETGEVEDDSMKFGFLFTSDAQAPETVSHMNGIREAQYKLGLTDNQIITKENITSDGAKKAIQELADSGCRIIFSTDACLEEAVVAAAGDYPEIEFCQEDGDQAKDSGIANMHNYYSRIYEAYFVEGIAAGIKINQMLNDGDISRSKCLIGFVADADNVENASCYNAFYLGLGRVCSQAHMYVRVVGTKGDYDADGTAARQLVAAGAGLIATHTYTSAVASVCAESGIPVFGNDINIINDAPKQAITSAVSDWSVYYTDAIRCITEGKDIPLDWCKGYKENAVGLTQLNDQYILDGTVEKLQEVEAGLRAGNVNVFDTGRFTVNGYRLESLVENNSDYAAYKKLIKDGAFKESMSQSKPSFHMMVDGIEFSTYDYIGVDNQDTTDDEE